MKISVRKFGDGYAAYLNDDKTKWEASLNPISVIGKLIITRHKEMGIELDEKDEH